MDRHDAARHQVGDEFIEMSLLQRLDRHFAAPVAQWLQTIAVGGLGRLAQTVSAGQPIRASLLDGERRAHHVGAPSGLVLEVAQGVARFLRGVESLVELGALFGDRVDAAVLLDVVADLAVLEGDLLDLWGELLARHRARVLPGISIR